MTKRTRNALLYTLGLVVVFAFQQFVLPKLQTPDSPTLPAPGYYRVVRDVDGDTIIVSMNGQNETVRFIGVDTPETHKPNSPVQCYGPDAAAFTKSQVEGKTVRLQADPQDDNRDKYGRLLRYVYLEDNTLLNKTLIQKGYGFVYILFPFTIKPEFIQAQFDAAKAKIGLWTACQTYQAGSKWQTNNL